MSYIRRVIDDELDELLEGLSAVAIEGPKAVGKTETAIQRAQTVRRFDDPTQASLARAEPSPTVSGDPPMLLDVPDVPNWTATSHGWLIATSRKPGNRFAGRTLCFDG